MTLNREVRPTVGLIPTTLFLSDGQTMDPSVYIVSANGHDHSISYRLVLTSVPRAANVRPMLAATPLPLELIRSVTSLPASHLNIPSTRILILVVSCSGLTTKS